MLLIGHRGCYYSGYNQNTIRSFAKVAEQGVQAIEFDVQKTSDDVLVIVHNLNLEEVSNGTGSVVETSYTDLQKLYAGDLSRGKDKIPTLEETLQFFAALPESERPQVHMELKGNGTGKDAGIMLQNFIEKGALSLDNVLASSFNWGELIAIRSVLPEIKVGLLEGAIHRKRLLAKLPLEIEDIFSRIFAYGEEDYMIPRFNNYADNLELIKTICLDSEVQSIIASEVEAALTGKYYNDKLIASAQEMNAASVNLWHLAVNANFVKHAHNAGLKVFTYTANHKDDLRRLAKIGVDGIFTDFFFESQQILNG